MAVETKQAKQGTEARSAAGQVDPSTLSHRDFVTWFRRQNSILVSPSDGIPSLDTPTERPVMKADGSPAPGEPAPGNWQDVELAETESVKTPANSHSLVDHSGDPEITSIDRMLDQVLQWELADISAEAVQKAGNLALAGA